MLFLFHRLKKSGDEELNQFLKNYPTSPYEAPYTQYLRLQDALDQYVERIKSPFIKNKIELNFLWAAK